MHRIPVTLTVVLIGIMLSSAAQPCSRVLWNDNGRSVLVGRNMDWFEDMRSNLWVLPRGMKRDGLVPGNPLTWTSRYGSLIVSGYESVTTDGVNEKGLGVHFLYLKGTKTSPRDEMIPGSSMSVWAQYYLDNFATVTEAVEALTHRLSSITAKCSLIDSQTTLHIFRAVCFPHILVQSHPFPSDCCRMNNSK
jgi:penicillin V acylase-like amidase (Ntn superfamily)